MLGCNCFSFNLSKAYCLSVQNQLLTFLAIGLNQVIQLLISERSNFVLIAYFVHHVRQNASQFHVLTQ